MPYSTYQYLDFHFLLVHNKAGKSAHGEGNEMEDKDDKKDKKDKKDVEDNKDEKDAEGNEERMKTCSLQRSWRMFVRHEGVLCLKLGGLRQQR